jgi:hypothetical protein
VLIQSCGSLKPALIPLIDLVKLFRNFEGSNALVAMYISYSKKPLKAVDLFFALQAYSIVFTDSDVL